MSITACKVSFVLFISAMNFIYLLPNSSFSRCVPDCQTDNAELPCSPGILGRNLEVSATGEAGGASGTQGKMWEVVWECNKSTLAGCFC